MMNATQDKYHIPPMKASDADRDQVLAVLSENFQAGRLTSEELEDRTGRALSARTLDELDALTSDLPDVIPAGLPESAAADQPPGPGFARLPIIAVVVAAIVIADVVLGASGAGHASHLLWALIAVPLVALRLAARRGRWTGSGRDLAGRRRRGPWTLG
jgi:Domain of unknown function (DUF1707)